MRALSGLVLGGFTALALLVGAADVEARGAGAAGGGGGGGGRGGGFAGGGPRGHGGTPAWVRQGYAGVWGQHHGWGRHQGWGRHGWNGGHGRGWNGGYARFDRGYGRFGRDRGEYGYGGYGYGGIPGYIPSGNGPLQAGGYQDGPVVQPSVGIPPTRVSPPAIYVIDGKGGRGRPAAASRSVPGSAGKGASRGAGPIVADSRGDGGSGVVIHRVQVNRN